MKFFLVTADRCDYDEYDSFVIRTTTAFKARKMAEEVANKYGSGQKWSATEIKLDGKEEVILDSFRAG